MGVIWHGLDAYERELASLPATASTATAPILTKSAEQTAVELRAAYPVVTGHLRDSVKVRIADRPLAPTTVIENTAAYAIPFEFGHGTAGGRHVFGPLVARKARAVKAEIGAMLIAECGAARVTDRDA
jgi:hypothetical protein